MKTWLYAAVAATALTVAGSASAATFTFQGFTNGCFVGASGCTPETTQAARTDVNDGLTFSNSTFNDMTSDSGFLSLGGNPGTPNVNNLGSFALSTANSNFNQDADDFILRVSFTAPGGTTPMSRTVFANLSGNVSQGGGGVLIDFANNMGNPLLFTFDGGSFSFFVNDLSVNPGQVASVTGTIQATAVPGPIAGAGLPVLMALGGLVWARRRKAAATA